VKVEKKIEFANSETAFWLGPEKPEKQCMKNNFLT
jgi:hypothetical protein